MSLWQTVFVRRQNLHFHSIPYSSRISNFHSNPTRSKHPRDLTAIQTFIQILLNANFHETSLQSKLLAVGRAAGCCRHRQKLKPLGSFLSPSQQNHLSIKYRSEILCGIMCEMVYEMVYDSSGEVSCECLCEGVCGMRCEMLVWDFVRGCV